MRKMPISVEPASGNAKKRRVRIRPLYLRPKAVAAVAAIVVPAFVALALVLRVSNSDDAPALAMDVAAAGTPTTVANLSVNTDPQGARVYLNGDLVGITPFESVGIEAGLYRVSTEMPGFGKQDTVVHLTDAHFLAMALPAIGELDERFADGSDSGHILAGLEDETLNASTDPTPSAGRLDEPDATSTSRKLALPVQEVQQQTPEQEPAQETSTPPIREREARQGTRRQTTATGNLSVTSEPSGATIWLDGQAVGTTPTDLNALRAGRHRIVMSMDGYEDYEVELDLKPRLRTPLHGNLLQNTGTIVLNIEPEGALEVDGVVRSASASGMQRLNLSAGSHTVKVTNPGYGVWEREVDVEIGTQVTYAVELQPEADAYGQARVEGETLFSKGDYDAARRAFTQALVARPGDGYVIARIAEIDRLVTVQQEQEATETIVENGVYLVTDTPPRLVGGLEALHKLVVYPEAAYQAGVKGRVYLQFLVDEEGVPSDIVVTKGLPLGCDEAAIRAVQQSRFEPGEFQGRKVKVRHALFINFGQ